uniref:Ulp1 protease family, C-terminal catalytic domain containing protein n=1 Tax=Solanum tuberosum TaxID=4113 RepID=M1DC74_SOLTU
MTRTRSMTSQKPSAPSSSFEVDILSLSSDSSTGSMASLSVSSKKRASTSKQKDSKKPRPLVAGSLSQADMQRFWGIEQKHRYDIFKSRLIVPGRVVNLSQLKDSLCPVSSYLKVQKLSLFFTLRGLELFEEVVRLFYANLCISPDSGELENLVLGNRIFINDLFFKDICGTKFSGVIPYMNGTWPDGFEVSLEGVKRVVAEPDSNISHFGALSLCFENRLLAHIVATTLIPRKGSLSNISTREVFVLYCLLRKYRINWAEWFKEYMWKSGEDTNASASLPYGLLISRILVDRLVDLSMFTPIVINATYDSRTFSTMGYV